MSFATGAWPGRVRSNGDVAGGRHFILAVTPRRAVVREAFPGRGAKPGKALCKGGVALPAGCPSPLSAQEPG